MVNAAKKNLKAASNAIKSGTPTTTAAFGIIRKINGNFPEERKSGVSSMLTKEEGKL